MNWPWEELGLPGPAELPLIRRAYAERLKNTRPDEDPDGFQRLRNAYQAASRLARLGGSQRGADDAPRQEDNGADACGQDDSPENEETVAEQEPVRKTWDFERLFAEEEAEKRGRRFQKMLELRRTNRFRYDTWNPPPSCNPAEAAVEWMAVSRAVALLEELVAGDAEAALWGRFCRSELFLYVRDRPDFVFALEDFLRESPEIPETACRTLFQAYRFEIAPVRWEYQPLYELLNEKTPAQSVPMRRTVRQRKTLWQSLPVILFLTIVLSMFNVCADFLIERNLQAEQVCAWLGEDFGGEFVRAEKWSWKPSFALMDTQSQTRFRAAWDGPRDIGQGRRGYVSNYAGARMAREIAAFAGAWNCAVSPRYASTADGDWNAFYLYLPLTGAGESVEALGNLLSVVRTEDWYRQSPPEFLLYLGWQDWSFYAYDAKTAEFDGPALRRYYERFFGPDLCRIVLRGTGIAKADMGEPFLLLPDSGTVRLENRDFFHVIGTGNPAVRPLYHYFLSDDGAELFRAPGDRKISELTLRELYGMDRTEYEVKGFWKPLTVFRTASDGNGTE